MRRLLIAMFVLVSLGASAQMQGFATAEGDGSIKFGNGLPEGQVYQVGQEVEIDGIPAFIYYIEEDSQGMHGLAITYRARDEKDLAKEVKKNKKPGIKGFADKGATLDMSKYKDILNDSKNRELYGALVSKFTKFGVDNHLAILDYCKKNNIDLEANYPMQAYCSKLGDGWFVPAEDELVKLSYFIFKHYGEKDKFGSSDEIKFMLSEVYKNSKICQECYNSITAKKGIVANMVVVPEKGVQAMNYLPSGNLKYHTIINNDKYKLKKGTALIVPQYAIKFPIHAVYKF